MQGGYPIHRLGQLAGMAASDWRRVLLIATLEVRGRGMVRMHRLGSASIRAIGYDKAAEELRIEFHSSPDPYVYFEVPPQVYRELEKAGSKGEYVNLMIKPYYRCEHRRRLIGASGRPKRHA